MAFKVDVHLEGAIEASNVCAMDGLLSGLLQWV